MEILEEEHKIRIEIMKKEMSYWDSKIKQIEKDN